MAKKLKLESTHCGATSEGHKVCQHCCHYCENKWCDRRCKNKPSKCGVMKENEK